jgi:hypothetical protein
MAQAQNDAQKQAAQHFLESAERAAEWQGASEKSGKTGTSAEPRGDASVSSAARAIPPAERASGPEFKFQGKVTESSCDHRKLYLTLDGEKASLQVRALDYSKINYLTYKWEPPPNFTPCRDLMGRTIRATYQKVAGDPPRGEVSTIEVLQ